MYKIVTAEHNRVRVSKMETTYENSKYDVILEFYKKNLNFWFEWLKLTDSRTFYLPLTNYINYNLKKQHNIWKA